MLDHRGVLRPVLSETQLLRNSGFWNGVSVLAKSLDFLTWGKPQFKGGISGKRVLAAFWEDCGGSVVASVLERFHFLSRTRVASQRGINRSEQLRTSPVKQSWMPWVMLDEITWITGLFYRIPPTPNNDVQPLYLFLSLFVYSSSVYLSKNI